MRIAAFASAVFALGLAGCGGATGPSVQGAAVQGVVYELDGQSLDLSGVDVTLMETGESATTDGLGGFRFDGLAPGTYTLGFEEGMRDGGDGDRDGDDVQDGEGRPRVEVPADGSDVEVRVRIEDGKVTEFSVGCRESRHAVARLFLAEGVERDLEGKIEVGVSEHGQRFAVCVWGLDAGTVIEVFVGGESAGVATATGEGGACLVREDVLPLGVEHVGELAGLRVDVVLASTQEALLVGEVPDLPEERPEEGEGGDANPEEGGGDLR